jgi:dethiobiotin synthetase
MRGVFVTGTDTDVGKSWVSAGLLARLRRDGVRALGMKPVSCGCEETAEGARNGDALLLMEHGARPVPAYALVNRYAFTPPVAPHLAAAATRTVIDFDLVRQDFAALAAQGDAVVVEGAGGWCVPLDERRTVADLAQAIGLPVLLVVGIRLGCLNHALLTSAAIQASGLEFAGWIANRIDPAALLAEDNIETLRRRIPAPLLGSVPHLPAFDSERVADSFEVGLLAAMGV